VCAGGVGILPSILNIDRAAPNFEFMRGVDIVMTAGLLASGSDAIHQFVRALQKFFVKP
jgi:hypothetical protein